MNCELAHLEITIYKVLLPFKILFESEVFKIIFFVLFNIVIHCMLMLVTLITKSKVIFVANVAASVCRLRFWMQLSC